ncbi:MAG: glycosyltransferase family 2 protein [Lachnospiraceae bacterium]|nr:glycosyltransferase family 2 protein [Lachnospiraceae bacterium]
MAQIFGGITISLCMIVKNEEKVLARCLDSIADLMDEIIIVDTGSTDRTKEIAARYTDHIYDFAWIDDFSAARNFAFSKAHMDYIYSADADEVLDTENRERYLRLKENLLPQVEIVQMKYGNQLQYGTVYNFDEEYRPKLFKRLREFVWQEPIHETIRLDPVVYDSDIVITHMPEESHAGRDLANFRKQTDKGVRLSAHLHEMYARELFVAGDDADFLQAERFFTESVKDTDRSASELTEACCVVAHAARLRGDTATFFKHVCKVIAGEGCSEICCELGHFYADAADYEEAAVWYYNAAYETQPVILLAAGGKLPLEELAHCYEKLGFAEQAEIYRQEAARRNAVSEEE